MKRESAPQETIRGYVEETWAAAGLRDEWSAMKWLLCRGGSASMKASTVPMSFAARKSLTIFSLIVSGNVDAVWPPTGAESA